VRVYITFKLLPVKWTLVQIASDADFYSTRPVGGCNGVMIVSLDEQEVPIRPLSDPKDSKGFSSTSGEPDRWRVPRP